ncbi:MAG: polyprenyl synthetase family protein [Bacillota bacterium]|nr:polyprenyl synthetase family protein [Bacillota bacterium]HHU60407.1 polyprenyl synthetase family protein [Natronincola sp.]
MENFLTYWDTTAEKIENILEEKLPGVQVMPELIHEAMRYSTLGGGKRLRGMLVMAACEAVGGDVKQTDGLAAAVEMVHAYSLIHDDLPCMDDDDLRRGKPSNHRVYGDAMAVLAGDALLTLAFEILAQMPEDYGICPSVAIKVIAELSTGAGSQGMVGGQVIDISSEGKKLTPQTLDYIHKHKTGALIKAALRGGALIGGASGKELELLTSYGESLGMAFQITDDILDEIGHADQLGKAIGADRDKGKQTYPRLYGLEKSIELAEACVAECLDALKGFTCKANILRYLATFIIQRDH